MITKSRTPVAVVDRVRPIVPRIRKSLTVLAADHRSAP